MPAGNPGGYSPAQKTIIGGVPDPRFGRTAGPTLVPDYGTERASRIADRRARHAARRGGLDTRAQSAMNLPTPHGAHIDRMQNTMLGRTMSHRQGTTGFQATGYSSMLGVMKGRYVGHKTGTARYNYDNRPVYGPRTRLETPGARAVTSATTKRAMTRGLARTGSIGMGAAASMGAMGFVGGAAGAGVSGGDMLTGAFAGAAGAAASVLAFSKGGGAIRSAAKMAMSAGAISSGTARMGVRTGQQLTRMSGNTVARGAAATAGAGLSGMMFSGSRSDKNHGFNRSRGNRIGG